MRNRTATAAGRALRATRWATAVGIGVMVVGNTVNALRWRQMSLTGVLVSALVGLVLAGAVFLVILLGDSTRRAAGGGLALFTATASTQLGQMKSVGAWRDDLASAKGGFGTHGFISGGLMLTGDFLVLEPSVDRYRMLMLPWSEVRRAVASDDRGHPGGVLLEVVCADGAEIAFLTTGRDRLRGALAAVGIAPRDSS